MSRFIKWLLPRLPSECIRSLHYRPFWGKMTTFYRISLGVALWLLCGEPFRRTSKVASKHRSNFSAPELRLSRVAIYSVIRTRHSSQSLSRGGRCPPGIRKVSLASSHCDNSLVHTQTPTQTHNDALRSPHGPFTTGEGSSALPQSGQSPQSPRDRKTLRGRFCPVDAALVARSSF
jgi:hypothetical protein